MTIRDNHSVISPRHLTLVAVGVLATFAVVMTVLIIGCFVIISGGIAIKDASAVAAVSGMLGMALNWVGTNAQTVIQFLFGGSRSSDNKSATIAAQIKDKP